MSRSACGAGALFSEIVLVGELSCVLGEPGIAKQLTYWPWCRFFHL